MDSAVRELLSRPFNLVVYHIGGGDEMIGPTGHILNAFKEHCLLVGFEIRSENTQPVELKTFRGGVKMLSVNRGIDIGTATRPFHINKFPLSSSLLKSSPMA